MKLSNRTEYGLRALVTLAERSGGAPMSTRQIAEIEGIPEPFLDQIMVLLRRAGIVKSVRGVNGGFLLAQSPDRVSVGEVVRVLEGSLLLIGCVDEENGDMWCERTPICHTRKVWVKLNEGITKALGSLTLAEVVETEEPTSQAQAGKGGWGGSYH
ncbi:RrF2 family transcriptional regulator [Kyrpidia tusciae]|uniref:Transcriptional regulator, BadM/Rrf2 family n=1 Tax=Kyrpidia tusciae (strain DSM 2912 / NBRC 15312 / T2) TaxID=562970 RepID=D5WUF4_KYRT2|nr:Rrf2 family transcriptional regulator [Kyrpidia tusciae]ADG05344.1 transcriptional regulator, BadM/Rrf2 family [Kyrpidia tusciae DSM 2912]